MSAAVESVAFSEEVNRVLQEALPSDDIFDEPDFDPLHYVNQHFPDDKSVEEIDAFIEDLDAMILSTNNELKETVRNQAVSSVDAEKNLEEAKASIRQLFKKVEEIRHMAEESESMVTEICTEISSLDNAKKNLTESITTLKKVRDLSRALDDLKSASDSRPPDLATAAECLYKCNSILDKHFQHHAEVPRVKELSEKLSREKKLCGQLAMQELKEVDLTSEDAVSPSIMDACGVIDACGEEARNLAVKSMVQRCIDRYKRAFHQGADEARLEKLERRFAWFRRLLKSYEDNVATYIPLSWCVAQELGVEFCLATREDIQLQLETDGGSLNVEILVRVLQKAADFEKDLTQRMKQYEKTEKDEGCVQPYSSSDPAALHAKWSKKLGKAPPDDETPKTSKKYKCEGFITGCFENTMDDYVKHEGARMKAAILTFMREDPEQIYSEQNQLGVNIFIHIKNSLKKCSSFCKDDVLVKMYDAWSENLRFFANELCKAIPSGTDDKDIHNLCTLLNSAEWCHEASSKLAEEVKTKLDESYVGDVDEDAAADQFRAVITGGTLQLISNLNKKLSPALNDMTSINWSTMDTVGDQSPYISNICSSISSYFILVGNTLQAPVYRYLCDKFIAVFVPRYISCFYRLKRVSPAACQQLLLDIQVLKAQCPKIPNLGAPDRFKEKELKTYGQIVKTHLGRGEAILKFLGTEIPATDGVTLAKHYLELVKDDVSIADFVRLLELKGVPQRDQKPLIDYLAKTEKVPQHSKNDPSSYQPPVVTSHTDTVGESTKEITEVLRRWKGRWGDGMMSRFNREGK